MSSIREPELSEEENISSLEEDEENISKLKKTETLSKINKTNNFSKIFKKKTDTLSKFNQSDAFSKFNQSDALYKFNQSGLSKFNQSDALSKLSQSDILSKEDSFDSRILSSEEDQPDSVFSHFEKNEDNSASPEVELDDEESDEAPRKLSTFSPSYSFAGSLVYRPLTLTGTLGPSGLISSLDFHEPQDLSQMDEVHEKDVNETDSQLKTNTHENEDIFPKKTVKFSKNSVEKDQKKIGNDARDIKSKKSVISENTSEILPKNGLNSEKAQKKEKKKKDKKGEIENRTGMFQEKNLENVVREKDREKKSEKKNAKEKVPKEKSAKVKIRKDSEQKNTEETILSEKTPQEISPENSVPWIHKKKLYSPIRKKRSRINQSENLDIPLYEDSPPNKKPRKVPREKISEDNSEKQKEKTSPRRSTRKKIFKQITDEDDEDEEDEEEEEKTPVEPIKIKKSREDKRKEILKLLDLDFSILKDDLLELFPETNKLKGPKEKIKSIFRGISFMVSGLITDNSTIASSLLDFEMKKAIKAMGGSIVNSIPSNSKKGNKTNNKTIPRPSCVVIAPDALRTFKYIIGLAARAPCLHYHWVVHCLKYERYIDPTGYLLPAGKTKRGTIKTINTSIVRDFPPDIDNLTFYEKEKGEPIRVEVVGTPEFKSQWSEVLYHAGARLVTRLFTEQEHRIDFVLSDNDPTDIVKKKAHVLDLPLCTTEWLIQCLIAQSVLSPEDHPDFFINLGDKK